MAVTFTGTFLTKFDWSYPNSVEGATEGQKWNSYQRFLATFTSGTGDNQCNCMWVARRTLSLASPIDSLDLAAGLTDQYGNTITLKELKILTVHNRGVVAGDADDETATPTAGEDLLIGGAGGNAWAALFNGDQDAQITLRTDGIFGVCAPRDGYSVSPGTEDILQIEHGGSEASGGDISYDIGIAGVQ